jgi:hypothetical protein
MAFALVYTAEHYVLDAADAADEPFTTFTYRDRSPACAGRARDAVR